MKPNTIIRGPLTLSPTETRKGKGKGKGEGEGEGEGHIYPAKPAAAEIFRQAPDDVDAGEVGVALVRVGLNAR